VAGDFEPELSDDDVVARVRGGEHALFEVLMRRHNRKVFRAVRAVLRSDDEAEDVMQHAYLRAFEHLAEYQARARFSTWLTRIAIYESFARLRRQKRVGQLDEDIAESEAMADQRATPEQRVSDAELRVITEAAIDALPADFRVVFVLRAVEQMSVADVADSLAIPEDTVKTRYFRARGRLRKSILERLDEATPAAFDFLGPRCDRVVARVLPLLAARTVG
jgi:RNA polymerase sigma-70 factor (ECF subfamily)